jgi:hypothetical protein
MNNYAFIQKNTNKINSFFGGENHGFEHIKLLDNRDACAPKIYINILNHVKLVVRL